ncbi:unnamed protein product [Pseudo-nitzschia multistriata]|uniref:SET domain-containing protein n=1 Tax=Pseudo-nitzschia multistriata TaxID=183589 RepID=A0A448ZD15_9STRA|nr:unnamed protein product [Pseudo-nitzschia multistriata]
MASTASAKTMATGLVLAQVLLSTMLPAVDSFVPSTTSFSDRIHVLDNDFSIRTNENKPINYNSCFHSRIQKSSTTETTLKAINAEETSSSSIPPQTEEEKERLEKICSGLNAAFEASRKDLTRTCNVKVGVSPNVDSYGEPVGSNMRLGWIATKDVNKGDILMNMPYDEQWEITPKTARKTVFSGILDDAYEGWTGETGLLALQLLNEVARSASTGGVQKPVRGPPIQAFLNEWINALPTPTELETQHPIFWSEEDQEILQQSSNTKIYRILDDIEEDANWLVTNIFEKDRATFPETVEIQSGETVPCFSVEGYKWAMALTNSRAFFVDGTIRLLPFMDMCNHDDEAKELQGGFMGTFGTTKGAEVLSTRRYRAGEEVFLSLGPKSAADYLLEHGFCPEDCLKTAVSEITLELDPEDRFYDDKIDILEFETYDQAPMDPSQSFDVVSAPGRDGEPDPALMQFARLKELNNMDAFLLESIFRKEVWGFMAYPVSEKNEFAVVESIAQLCETAMEDMKSCPEPEQEGPNSEVCAKLRASETRALRRTLEYMLRDKEALDLKEYYQERRLKDLGLDSEWSPEDDIGDPDLNWGQTRSPGGADFDW